MSNTVGSALDNAAGKAQSSAGLSGPKFLASLASAGVIFGIEALLFVLLKNKLSRIYLPRTYLVSEKERTKAPPTGIISWITPVFQTTNTEFIQKCGLDAYYFLRFLRTLLRLFIPLAALILPILLPLNYVGGRGPNYGKSHPEIVKDATSRAADVTGLDQLAFGNVRPENYRRYWAHLILAIIVVGYTCYVFHDELRSYIRLRQAYLTSPQHRLRASATTVLVSAIPRKWLTIDALDGLYDVFPGGIRNIWINRNFDALSEKVHRRNKLALALEAAQTELIRNAKKAQIKQEQRAAKMAGQKMGATEKRRQQEQNEVEGRRLAEQDGNSAGDPHQVRHTLLEAFHRDRHPPIAPDEGAGRIRGPIPILGHGLQAVGHGVGAVGNTVFRGFKRSGKEIGERFTTAPGFVPTAGVSETSSPSPPVDQAEISHDAATDTRPPKELASSGVLQPQDMHQLTVPQVDGLGDRRGLEPRLSGPLEGEPDNSENAPDSAEKGWMSWAGAQHEKQYELPSPQPNTRAGAGRFNDDQPLTDLSPSTPHAAAGDFETDRAEASAGTWSWVPFMGTNQEEKKVEYPPAFSEDADEDEGEPEWRKYLKPAERDSMRLPIFGWEWMPALPLVGKKVDTILYCRKEVARLNVEIERDQQNPEDFPLMNSAFVQFNHQVAAHMACQSVSHHVPKQMAPRIVEISPDDVLWDNMSIRWWESYIRTILVVAFVGGLIVLWAVPVAFTGTLSSIDTLTKTVKWLDWLNRLPSWLLSLVQGVLPQALLAGLLALLPLILRFLAKQQGVQTGMGVELSVQTYFFAFLFIQVFLVVSISTGITATIQELLHNPSNVAGILAKNLPRATNYFFSYMILQAFSVSGGALLQIGALISWFILAPVLDNTARQKWARQTDLPVMRWGTFFPVYTNLAAIGLVYSVISPLIMVFNIITFGLFWIVYRYNTLYVTKFRFDTGGLLFPRAIDQLFTGLYFMELCLIGLFFLVRDLEGKARCIPQAIIMIVVLAATVFYQRLLDDAFGPLVRYLPITLEDEAVERDQAFTRAQRKRLNITNADEDDGEGEGMENTAEDGERAQSRADHDAEAIEMEEIASRRTRRFIPNNLSHLAKVRGSWADRSLNHRDNARSVGFGRHPKVQADTSPSEPFTSRDKDEDVERQNPVATALFSGINDEIEALTPDERDLLIQRAFQHEAMRAKRPVIWIPRDNIGVSDDEIYRTQRFSKHIWISNEHTGLDGKGRVVFRRSPPDFSEVDLIEL